MVRLVTGGTGFIGRHLLRQLARREGATYVLVRPASHERLETYIESIGAGDRLHPVRGDITAPALGLSAGDQEKLGGADIYHLAAVYDLEASEEDNQHANVDGTRHLVELAERIGARIHHISSIRGGRQSLEGQVQRANVRRGAGPGPCLLPNQVRRRKDCPRVAGALSDLPPRPGDRLFGDRGGRPHRWSLLRLQIHPAIAQRDPALGATGRP